ncbi:acyl-CoA-binding domain-containing protein 3-like isoform X3 [Camellia sinensis]|uniref:acyl-CoA-binding domain-containing protein 3-like isoform X3 n=1 Tax=Camellia sinensis TaxID=4442 RepID=UPI00103673A1|nr:acyl-CoA-binding domain-containing protein 3-like isoform X3 [Camellia sinensis]
MPCSDLQNPFLSAPSPPLSLSLSLSIIVKDLHDSILSLSLSLYMELFQELMFTVGLSLLVFFVIAKHFSMASSSDPAGDNSVSVSVIGVITEQNRPQKSVVWDSASERRVCFVDEAVEFDEHVEEPRAEAVGSPLICGDEELDDGEEVFEEFLNVGLENEANLFDECSKWEKFREIGIESEDLVEKCSEKAGVREIGIESGNDGESVAKFEEVRVLESEDNKRNESVDEICGKETGFFDDWEGIERTELEKRFGDAVVFAGSKSNADRILSLDNDSKMQLYGLHKVAIEGRCRLPQPMALKVSARAKWNAWRQLGDMNREVAMEQYIALMSRSIPGWMGGDTEDGKQVSSDAGASTNLPFNLHKLVGTENESISEERKPCDGGCGMIGVEGFEGSNSVNREREE